MGSSAISEVDTTPGNINSGVSEADTDHELEEFESVGTETPLNLNKISQKVASNFYGPDSVTPVTPQLPVTPAPDISGESKKADTPKKSETPKNNHANVTPK